MIGFGLGSPPCYKKKKPPRHHQICSSALKTILSFAATDTSFLIMHLNLAVYVYLNR